LLAAALATGWTCPELGSVLARVTLLGTLAGGRAASITAGAPERHRGEFKG
jgi:hypothetical protein